MIYLSIGQPVNTTNIEAIANGTRNVKPIPNIVEVCLLFIIEQHHKPNTNIQMNPDQIGKVVNDTLNLLTPPPLPSEEQGSTSKSPGTLEKTTAMLGFLGNGSDEGSHGGTTGKPVTFPEEVTQPSTGESSDEGKSTTGVSGEGTGEGSRGTTTDQGVTFPQESTGSDTSESSVKEEGTTEAGSHKGGTTKEGSEVGSTPFPLTPDPTSVRSFSICLDFDSKLL